MERSKSILGRDGLYYRIPYFDEFDDSGNQPYGNNTADELRLSEQLSPNIPLLQTDSSMSRSGNEEDSQGLLSLPIAGMGNMTSRFVPTGVFSRLSARGINSPVSMADTDNSGRNSVQVNIAPRNLPLSTMPGNEEAELSQAPSMQGTMNISPGLLRRFASPTAADSPTDSVPIYPQANEQLRPLPYRSLADRKVNMNLYRPDLRLDQFSDFGDGLDSVNSNDPASSSQTSLALNKQSPSGYGVSNAETADTDGDKITEKLFDTQLMKIMREREDARIPVGMSLKNRPEEIAVAIGQDLSGAMHGMTGKNMQADRATIINNIERDLRQIDMLAKSEGYTKENTAMLKNTFVLARYDALTKANPDFLWTRLGIYAANTVRMGLVKSYDVAHAIDAVGAALPLVKGASGLLGGMTAPALGELSRSMADDTLEGQLGVLKDVGSLSLMHKLYGAKAMRDASANDIAGYTKEAQASFRLQAEAEAAKEQGDLKTYYEKQTAAAIEMGRHEQGNLQKMWNKFAMEKFAKLNAFLLRKTGSGIVHPDIYLGTNPVNDKEYAKLIPVPAGSEDLTSLENRVNIARNGFDTINAMRQTPEGDQMLRYHQEQLGQAKKLMQPVFKTGWWKLNGGT